MAQFVYVCSTCNRRWFGLDPQTGEEHCPWCLLLQLGLQVAEFKNSFGSDWKMDQIAEKLNQFNQGGD